MSKKITFTIEKGGNVVVKDAQGYGNGCQQATQDIEKLLGSVDESSRALTDNYYVEAEPEKLKVNVG